MNLRLAVGTLLLLLSLYPSALVAETVAINDTDELQQLLNQFLDGASRNDAAIHDRFWSEDLIYTSSSGTRFGKSELMSSVRNAEPDDAAPTVQYRAEQTDIRLYGTTAVVAFTLIADGADQRYFNTGTFVKRDHQWRAVAWQATKIPAVDSAEPAN